LGDHGRYVVREVDILGWAVREAARLRAPDHVQVEHSNEERRVAIEDRMARARELYLEEGDKAAWEREKARANEAMRALDAEVALETVPLLDWAWPAADVNSVLRAMWSYIRLDTAMRPVDAVWLVPEWRA
jgi:hypothetical protein